MSGGSRGLWPRPANTKLAITIGREWCRVTDNIPQHISTALDSLGIVLLVKKPEPMRDPPQPSGWMPSFKGEECLF